MTIHDDLLARRGRAALRPDCIQAGTGPVVLLLHASMAGAKQWLGLISALEPRFHVRAVNLFGYGQTPAWRGPRPASLDDFAALALAAVPKRAGSVHLVGHSLGGAVAIRAAQALGGRVASLTLIEPSCFGLLQGCGRSEALAEIAQLADETAHQLACGRSERAARRFIDYWCGTGAWLAMSERTRASVLATIAQLPSEWAAVLDDQTDLGTLQRTLPARTFLMGFKNTVRPSRELVELLSSAFPYWLVATVTEAGHMGPLTHPHIVNPILRDFLGWAVADKQAA